MFLYFGDLQILWWLKAAIGSDSRYGLRSSFAPQSPRSDASIHSTTVGWGPGGGMLDLQVQKTELVLVHEGFTGW